MSPILLVGLGLAVVLVIGAVGVGFALVKSAGEGVSGPVEAGQCVDTSFTTNSGNRIPASARVKCDDPEAKAKILKVTSAGAVMGYERRPEPDCPDGTDGVTNVRVASDKPQHFEACARNLKGPHPGDPGAGGALLTAGDCVTGGSIGLGGQEKPCSGNDWYGKVIARVDSEKSCPAKTLETMQLRSFGGGDLPRPVLCLGAGGGVLATGDCIADPSFAVGAPKRADCRTQTAVAKVVGRVKTQQECPAETNGVMTAKRGYLPVMCLKQLRPTLNDKIRSLGN